MLKRKLFKLSRMTVGYTQIELAKKIGVKERDITLIETGRRQPSPVIAKRIAKILDIDKEKLFPDLFLEKNNEESNIKTK